VVVLPLVAVSLAQGRLAEAVQLSSILLKPTADWSPDRLLAAIRRAVEESEAQLPDETAVYMQDVLRIAQEYGCL